MASAYARQLALIPLEEEPHLSVLNAIYDTQIEDNDFMVQWHALEFGVAMHLKDCPRCAAVFGGLGKSPVGPCTIAAGNHIGPEED